MAGRTVRFLGYVPPKRVPGTQDELSGITDPSVIEPIRKRLEWAADQLRAKRSDFRFRQLALNIVGGKDDEGRWLAPERDYVAELGLIFDWIKKNVRYANDPIGGDVLYVPEVTMGLQGGDCDCQTLLIASIVQTIGYPVKLRAVSYDGEVFSHVYPVVGIIRGPQRGWVAMDTVIGKRPGDERVFRAKLDVMV